MKLYVLKTTDPYLNLAIEEYLFRKSDDSVFILWQNYNTVVIGKNQNAYCEVNAEYAEAHGIKTARRITGGGAVYHDLGNVNYSFISKSANNGIDFKTFTEPIISLLVDLGVPAALSGRNDILVGEKKISGNAQFSSNGRVLHHGTILFDSDLSTLSAALNVDPEKVSSRAVKSTRSRVANLKDFLNKDVSALEFILLLKDYVVRRFSAEICEIEPNDEIKTLASRNASKEWLYPERDFLESYILRKKQRFDFGTIDVNLEMRGVTIKKIAIHGDFFGNSSISELENLLCGADISRLENVLLNISVCDYIFGMSNEDFVTLIRK